jgi:hypothetical protein
MTKSTTTQVAEEQYAITDKVDAIDLSNSSANSISRRVKSFSEVYTYTYRLDEVCGAVNVSDCPLNLIYFHQTLFFRRPHNHVVQARHHANKYKRDKLAEYAVR